MDISNSSEILNVSKNKKTFSFSVFFGEVESDINNEYKNRMNLSLPNTQFVSFVILDLSNTIIQSHCSTHKSQ